jgi:hypothetical protein
LTSSETKGRICVSTVSIVCGRDSGLPDRRCGPQIMAIGATDVTGWLSRRALAAHAAAGILEYAMYPDDPGSGGAFTSEGNLDAERPQERLRAPQAAGQRGDF